MTRPGHDGGRGVAVSIVVPLRDEEDRVDDLMAAIAGQTFAGGVELLVADGGSRDRSLERLRNAATRCGLPLTVIDNPAGLIPNGLNLCVRRARGDFIVRMDCGGRFGPDYIDRCVADLRAGGAWNVGGIIVPAGDGCVQRAVACAMESPFGGIGWTRHLHGTEPVEVDTVYCGTFPREVFDEVGLFDESLPWNEDEDFNFRLRDAGGRVMLDPTIRVAYRPPRSLAGVLVRYRRYGSGKVELMRKHRRVMSARSLAPAALVGSMAGLSVASARYPGARRLLATEAAVYVGAGLTLAWRAVRARRESPALVPAVAIVFATMHVGYGAGMAEGVVKATTAPRRR